MSVLSARAFLSVQYQPSRINGLANVENDTVFSCTSPEQEVLQGKNIVDAAKEHGIQHMVWSTPERTEYKITHFETKYFCTSS